jgi:hypothetical protein
LRKAKKIRVTRKYPQRESRQTCIETMPKLAGKIERLAELRPIKTHPVFDPTNQGLHGSTRTRQIPDLAKHPAEQQMSGRHIGRSI